MLINYRNVDIYQEDNLVLQGVNLRVDEGEFVYLTGVVGSGKTSLMKTIYAELDVKGDEATVLGTDLLHIKRKHIPALRRQLGIVFQDFRLLTDRTVAENLDFVLRATGWKKKEERQQRIHEVLQKVGLADKEKIMPYELSGGEQQRVCIARAILNSPRLILADEATGNQDPESVIQTVEILHQLAQQGTAVILSTHNDALMKQFPGIVFRCQSHNFICQADDDLPVAELA